MTQLTARSLLDGWNQAIRTLADGEGTDLTLRKGEGFGPLTIQFKSLKNRITLASAGFQSRRWMRYVDDYLQGGPAFVAYLNGRWKTHPVFMFGGAQQHTLGACITKMVLTPGKIYLSSRACDICPTGVLDLTLLWWVSQVTRIPQAQWEIERAKLTVWQGIARRQILPVVAGTRLGLEFEEYLRSNERTYQTVKFARARSALRRRTFEGSLDEVDVIRSPIRINPNDLQLLYGIRRTKIQGFVSTKFGWSAQGSGNRSYSWTSYQDPVFQAILTRFKLDPQRLPPIEEVAQARAARFNEDHPD